MGAAVTAAVPLFAVLALPVLAAGAAALSFSGGWVVTAVVSLVATVGIGLFMPTNLVFAVPAVVAVIAAAVLLKGRSYQMVGLALVIVFAVASFGSDAVAARVGGTSVQDVFTTQAPAAVEQALATTDSLSALQRDDIARLVDVLARTWPSAYVLFGLITAIAVMASLGWTARRAQRVSEVPALQRVDLNINVVWLPIAALVALAAGTMMDPNGIAFVVGINLAIVSVPLLLVQGFAVISAVMNKLGFPTAIRVLVYVAIMFVSALVLGACLVGLADFWANFRKLPRDGMPAPVAKTRE